MQSKVGRNDPCTCGSGKKFKQCCGLAETRKTVSSSPTPIVMQALRSAWLNIQAGKLKQANDVCHQILHAYPNQVEALHLLGISGLKDGDIEAAIHFLNQAIKKNPSNPEYHSNLGLAYHEQGKLELANAEYQRALALNSNYADVYYNLHALRLNSPAESAKCLERALAINPFDFDAKLMLAIVQEYLGNPDKSLQLAEELRVAPSLIRSRLEAWQYLKSASKTKLPILGSNWDTFQYAIDQTNIEGLILEFGVRNGNSIRQLAGLASQKVHGFDSFEGLPEAWHLESKGSYSTHGKLPKVPQNVELHQGWFDQVLPAFIEKNPGSVRLLNIDCDIYSSTVTVLNLLAPRIVTGTVIIFDEYIGNEHWREDEYKAFQEAVKRFGWSYEYLCFSMFTKQVVVRITKA